MPKIIRDPATDFLYWNPLGGGFPNDNIAIRAEFEVGGTYENWGFSVFRLEFVQLDENKRGLYRIRTIATGRSLNDAIEKARQSFAKNKDGENARN